MSEAVENTVVNSGYMRCVAQFGTTCKIYKTWKITMEECSYSKVTGCFSRFLNCTNVTKSRKTSQWSRRLKKGIPNNNWLPSIWLKQFRSLFLSKAFWWRPYMQSVEFVFIMISLVVVPKHQQTQAL